MDRGIHEGHQGVLGRVAVKNLRTAVAVLLAALYVWGLAPSVHVHDAGELTAAAWTLGVGHPPGAPLYMLLSKAFLLLVPLGSIAFRANLFSAAAAVAAFLAFDALARRVTGRPGLSLAGASAFALSPTFWSQAEMAEVYTLQALLILAFFWAFVESLEGLYPKGLPAFFWGLLLACHMGLSPITPLVLLVLGRPPQGGWIQWAKGILRLVPPMILPMLLYAYVPLRSLADPPVDWGNPETPSALWWHLTNRQVRGRMLSLPWDDYVSRAGDYLKILGSNLHILLPLAAMGVIFGWKRARPFTLLLLLVLAADVGFVVLMDTAPLASEAYAIPSVLVLALLAVVGADRFAGRAASRAAAALLAGGAALSLFTGFAPNDLHKNFLVRDASEALLQQTPPGAVLIVQEDSTTNPLAYLVEVEGARTDVEIYDRFGNLFRSLYDRRPFLLLASERTAYRRSREEPAVERWLRDGRPVSFSTPFLDYAPSRFLLVPGTYASAATPPGAPVPGVAGGQIPRPRCGPHPDWMSRQMMAELATRRAEAYLGSGKTKEAGESLREAISTADLPELFLRIAQIARRAGDGELALEAAREALSRNPRMAPALSLQGAVLMDSGREDESAQVLRAASDADPTLAQPHALLGLAAARRKDWGSARAAFDKSLELDPDQPELLYDRALVKISSGDTTAAEPDLRRTLALAPGHRKARLLLAQLQIRAGRKAEARDILCEICSRNPASKEAAKDLQEVLLLAAGAGFPPCVEEWLDRSPPTSMDGKALAVSYSATAQKVRGAQQR
jgi:Tfp pilus assembly protein PilF